jgi:hypothetical protein
VKPRLFFARLVQPDEEWIYFVLCVYNYVDCRLHDCYFINIFLNKNRHYRCLTDFLMSGGGSGGRALRGSSSSRGWVINILSNVCVLLLLTQRFSLCLFSFWIWYR